MKRDLHEHSVLARRGRRAFGTFLLILPLCGLAFQLTVAQAQPMPAANALAGPGQITPEIKADADQVMSIARNMEICKYALNLKLEDATLEDAAARIKATFPDQQIEIRQRDARPLKVSLDLKETTIGSVLSAIATLTDCQLWVLPDGLLIAPPDKLDTLEKDLVQNRVAGAWGSVWTNSSKGIPLLTAAIVAEALGGKPGAIKTTLDKFSPESRAMLQQLANWQRGNFASVNRPPLMLRPDSPVEVSFNENNEISLKIEDGGASNPKTGALSILIRSGDSYSVRSEASQIRWKVLPPAPLLPLNLSR